jgi:glycosyltransferase involved in cell wall biosynthesis
LSFARLFAPLRLLYFLFKVKPSIVIFNTPEILYVITFYKLVSRCKIIYDIQENYFRNVYFNRNYLLPFRFLLAYAIRLKEWSARWLIDRNVFAEEGYKEEMPRSAKNTVVISNTYKILKPTGLDYIKYGDDKDPGDINSKVQNTQTFNANASSDENVLNCQAMGEGVTFLFSGTISDNYGIFTAIDFIDAMHKVDPINNLLIAGFCANKKIFRKLIKRIENKPYIKLIGGSHRVPHQEIIQYIRIADFGLICYEINPSTENCFPTKIFEYMANQLPMIIQNYGPWSSFCKKHNAGIEVDYHSFNPQNLADSIKTETFYTRGIPEEVFWTNDERKLLKLVEDIQS